MLLQRESFPSPFLVWTPKEKEEEPEEPAGCSHESSENVLLHEETDRRREDDKLTDCSAQLVGWLAIPPRKGGGGSASQRRLPPAQLFVWMVSSAATLLNGGGSPANPKDFKSNRKTSTRRWKQKQNNKSTCYSSPHEMTDPLSHVCIWHLLFVHPAAILSNPCIYSVALRVNLKRQDIFRVNRHSAYLVSKVSWVPSPGSAVLKA